MTAASLGIAQERSGRLASVAGTLERLAEVRDRLLVAAFTAELIEKLPDCIAPVNARRELERQPLHDGGEVLGVARARGLRRGRSAQGGAGGDGERQEQSQPAGARHADAS